MLSPMHFVGPHTPRSLHRRRNVLMPFYESKIVKDDKNVSRNLIKLYQPSVMFEKTHYYYNETSPSPTHRRIVDRSIDVGVWNLPELSSLIGFSGKYLYVNPVKQQNKAIRPTMRPQFCGSFSSLFLSFFSSVFTSNLFLVSVKVELLWRTDPLKS